MKIKLEKTKVMRISRNDGRKIAIQIDGEKLQQGTKFNYLGSTITEDCKSSSEIRRQIILEKEAFNKKKELLCGKLGLNLKKRLIKTLIWSGVVYGLENLAMQKEDIKRLEAFETWLCKRTMKVKWTEHKTNEEGMDMMKGKRMLINAIRERQMNWVGHVLRSGKWKKEGSRKTTNAVTRLDDT
jgi:hypothetical protein